MCWYLCNLRFFCPTSCLGSGWWARAGVPVEERMLALDRAYSFLCCVAITPGRSLGVSAWAVEW